MHRTVLDRLKKEWRVLDPLPKLLGKIVAGYLVLLLVLSVLEQVENFVLK